jgi:hypothetical protein
MKLLLQKIQSVETKDVGKYTTTNDIEFKRVKFEDIRTIKNLESYMPVGSVEFVQEYFRLAQIGQPTFDHYNEKIKDNLNRNIEIITRGDLIHYDLPIFVKPTKLKQFNGFVLKWFNTVMYDKHDRDQLYILSNLSYKETVYVSPVVNFIAEWRIYVTKGKVVAVCQYDSGEEDLTPDENFVKLVSEKFPTETLAIDIGLLDNNQYCVVELNDAWSIGKYKGISDKDYFEFLTTRWNEI